MHAASARRFLLAALVAVAVGGCGSEDSAPADVERMLRAGLTTTQPEVLCQRTLSAKLVMRVYGGVEQCLAAERGSAASRMPARSAEISRVEIDGDRGTAFVALTGGDPDGTRGTMTVVRENGGWRLDELSTQFLRSQLKASAANDPALSRELSACLAASVDELSDADLRQLALGAMGARSEALEQIGAIAARCVRQLEAPVGGDVA